VCTRYRCEGNLYERSKIAAGEIIRTSYGSGNIKVGSKKRAREKEKKKKERGVLMQSRSGGIGQQREVYNAFLILTS